MKFNVGLNECRNNPCQIIVFFFGIERSLWNPLYDNMHDAFWGLCLWTNASFHPHIVCSWRCWHLTILELRNGDGFTMHVQLYNRWSWQSSSHDIPWPFKESRWLTWFIHARNRTPATYQKHCYKGWWVVVLYWCSKHCVISAYNRVNHWVEVPLASKLGATCGYKYP